MRLRMEIATSRKDVDIFGATKVIESADFVPALGSDVHVFQGDPALHVSMVVVGVTYMPFLPEGSEVVVTLSLVGYLGEHMDKESMSAYYASMKQLESEGWILHTVQDMLDVLDDKKPN